LPEESVQGPEPLLLDPFEPLLRSSEGRRRLAPDFILQLGAMPTSKGLGLLFAEASCPRIAITPWGWPDPSGAASELLYADLEEAVDAIEAILDAGGEEGWGAEADGAPSAARSAPRSAPPSAARDAANAAHAEAHSEALRLGAALHLEQDRLLETEPGLSEAACVRELLAALPEGSLLTVANSLSVRQLDAWVPSRPAGLRVASQRGASGIDGSIAGALGAASAHRGPSALLLGDIAFLHDLGSLLLARDHAPRRWPFVILAVNNDGGRIFEQLPIAGRRDLEAQLSRFITPHGLELAPLARGLGLPHRQVGDRASLREALEGALDSSGCTVIEARVPPGVAASLERRCAAFVESLLAQTGAR
ncbi:MAG: thiamine pyrophosphate-dependent enzyme, partial [Myxococcales bacterium]|nr:thiamine pyrophosphate-dependent enzyme [Myxococcales bacterium]